LKKLLGLAYALIAALGIAIVVAADLLMHESPPPTRDTAAASAVQAQTGMSVDDATGGDR
jgi:hypothetical protein